IVIGAIAGITATVAMTVAMDVLFRKLPPKDRYPLPPRELTERSTARLGLRGRLDEHDLQAATLLSHFGFGAVAGALYGCLAIPRKRATALLGIGYALAVWTVSYLGWVPGLALLRSATRHPPR